MTKHLLPQKLISFRNLHGGTYGTLDVTARDPATIELALGADSVWIGRDQWAALRAAIDPIFGLELDTVVVATDAYGDPMVIEQRERVAPAAKKRTKGSGGGRKAPTARAEPTE